MEQTRTCPYCKIDKPFSEFYKSSTNKRGIGYYCKLCSCIKAVERYRKNPEKNRKRAHDWYIEHPDKAEEYRKTNSEQIKLKQKAYRVAHPELQHKNRKEHPEIERERAKKYYDLHPEIVEERNRRRREEKCERVYEYNIKVNYGITLEEYDKILFNQNGKCKICGKENGKRYKRLHIDHNHATGKIRGLLCHSCNVAIGFLHDDPELLQRAIDYLNESEE